MLGGGPAGGYWKIELPPSGLDDPPRLADTNRLPGVGVGVCPRAASGIPERAVQTARTVAIISRIFIVGSFRNRRGKSCDWMFAFMFVSVFVQAGLFNRFHHSSPRFAGRSSRKSLFFVEAGLLNCIKLQSSSARKPGIILTRRFEQRSHFG